jgi:hypothetical protein
MKPLDSIFLPIVISLQFLGCLFLLLSMFTLGPYGGAPGRPGFFAVLVSFYLVGLASAAYLNTRTRRSRAMAAAWNLVLGVYLMMSQSRGTNILADYGLFVAMYLAATSLAVWDEGAKGTDSE